MPFYAGHRIAAILDVDGHGLPQDMVTISPHLSAAERRHLKEVGDPFFVRWVTIGGVFYHIEQAMTWARAN